MLSNMPCARCAAEHVIHALVPYVFISCPCVCGRLSDVSVPGLKRLSVEHLFHVACRVPWVGSHRMFVLKASAQIVSVLRSFTFLRDVQVVF